MLKESEEYLNDDLAALGMERAFLSITPKVDYQREIKNLKIGDIKIKTAAHQKETHKTHTLLHHTSAEQLWGFTLTLILEYTRRYTLFVEVDQSCHDGQPV